MYQHGVGIFFPFRTDMRVIIEFVAFFKEMI